VARVSVVGARGSIGKAIVHEALERGHQVTAVVRSGGVNREHPSLTVAIGDALDPHDMVRVAKGQDAVVSAVGARDGQGHRVLIEPSLRTLVASLRGLGDGAPRLLAVGGAGSLETSPGSRVWDFPGLPKDVLETMHAHGDGLEYLRSVTDVAWTCLSPAAMISPGVRTGRYRTGGDQLLMDAGGTSRISIADYAVAMVDEIETPRHLGRRFTVAY
jgi:putative NADH-flavin reductase